MYKENKRNAGITLIALVITIIVLLILAGISISMLAGQNSILSRAGEAKTRTEEKSKEELIQLEVIGSIGEDGKIDVPTLKTNLAKIGATPSEANSLPLTVILGGQQFTVDTNGNVTKAGDTLVSNFGYNSADNCFIGQKSVEVWTDDETGESGEHINNTQTSNPTEDGTGYIFTAGHWLYDEENGDYLCWDADYGTIESKQDLYNYADTHEVIVYWDVFDSSGAWFSNDNKLPKNWK